MQEYVILSSQFLRQKVVKPCSEGSSVSGGGIPNLGTILYHYTDLSRILMNITNSLYHIQQSSLPTHAEHNYHVT